MEAPLSIGDLVWVKMGSGTHEEPATVVEFDCKTAYGEDGIKCKIQVSAFEGVFPVDAVRSMNDNSRRSRRSARSAAVVAAVPEEKKTTPVSKKRKGTPKKKAITSATESPHFVSKKDNNENKGEDNDSETKPPAKKRAKKAVQKKKSPAAKKLIMSQDLDLSEDDKALSTLKAKDAAATKRKKLPAKKKLIVKDDDNEEDDESTKTKKPPAKKKKAAAAPKKKKAPVKKKAAVAAVEIDSADESDTDHPFTIEYSSTGRATCKRCDELIAKGSVRVSHIPLFRGKPGYKAYRHLKCCVFGEDVLTPQDVGGWRKLQKEDYDELVVRVEESKEEIKKEMEELDPDELVPVTFQGAMRPSPPGLTADLLPFQVEGVSWMHHKEVEDEVGGVRGGMLCDEMGMGKTIQTIVTILDNRPKLQHSKIGAKHPPAEREVREAEERLWSKGVDDWEHEMNMNNVPKSIRPKATAKLPGGGGRAGTLVICPVIALSQWKAEIEKFTEGGTLTVGTYHGPNRASEMPRELMCKYDVVLTTYQILEQDFRKMTSPNKIKCPNCGGKFKVDKLRVHLKYFCGEGAERTEAQSRQRRSCPGGGGGPDGGSSNKGKGKKNKGSQKKTMEPKKMPGKRIKKVGSYDSESELSDVETTVVTKGRSSRSAAITASKRLSSSSKDWGAQTKDQDSDEYEDDQDSSEDSSEDEVPPKRKVFAKKGAKHMVDSSDDEDSSEDEALNKRKSFAKKGSKKIAESDDDSDVIIRARQKQSEAFTQASAKGAKGKKNAVKKKAPLKKLAPKKKVGKGKGAKKKASNSDSEDSSSDEDPVDPMEGIDMDALMKEAMEGSKMSLLHGLCWWRIVLDEAHMIKSRSSQTANAAFALIAVHRWCLSGTPLQNRVGEVYSLIRFLRIDPMAHYFCRAKECDCKSLHYRMLNAKCQDCGHSSVQHFSHFNKHVLNPIQRAGYSGDGRRAMFTLKKDILDKSLLRRTKENRAADMKLPPRIVTVRTVRLHPIEEDFYNALYTQTQSSFNDYVSEGTLLNNYAHIFDLLMRMRQATDHPYLVVYSKKDMKARAANGATIANGSVDCGICHESPTDRVLSSCCEEGFCRSCVQDYMALDRDGASIPCPGCRAPFSIDLNQVSSDQLVDTAKQASSEPMPSLKEMSNVATGSILRRINLAEFATSTKIEALVEELVRMRETSPGSKAIVFSQFVNMLDLIRWRLHSDPCLRQMGLGAKALHGGMDVKARDASLKDFREDSSVRVLLISLKAGGVALNLTVANHIYLMDPWWNPAAEYQAIDRTHRLGQYRPIRAVRFIAEDTVEERILQLQEKKRLVFDGTIGRDAGSLQMLTVDDMKSLFQ